MNPRFIIIDFIASLRSWTRSIGTVFWTLLFPVLLIMIFGAIFSGANEVQYDLVVQDLDGSTFSEQFIDVLNKIPILRIDTNISSDDNIQDYLDANDKSVALQIPEGFGEKIQSSFTDNDVSVNLSYFFDPSDQTTAPIIRNIISSTIYEFNLGLTHGRRVIGLDDESILGEDFEYIDFFVPGMIGFTIMTSCIYGSIERNTKYRKDGILRKLLTMPVSRAEWILAKMLFMLFLSFLSAIVILLVGVLFWGLTIKINLFFFVLIIATSFLFSGIGMLVGRFVKEEETADMAGGAITFPMMFLSGTFFPLDQMPDFLQSFAQVLPLYYVNEGLRNAMIFENFDKTLVFTFFVIVFAAVFFIAGVFLTKWHED